MTKLKLNKVVTLSEEEAKSLAETPWNRAAHIFIDLKRHRGEYVSSREAAEAERCRERNPDYNPFFIA